MEYFDILQQINANQVEILSLLGVIKDMLSIISSLGAVYFIYVFIRNLIKK